MTSKTAARKFLLNWFGQDYANNDALAEVLDEYASHFEDPLEALERLSINDIANFMIRAERRANLA
jgi:hypothetical protein